MDLRGDFHTATHCLQCFVKNDKLERGNTCCITCIRCMGNICGDAKYTWRLMESLRGYLDVYTGNCRICNKSKCGIGFKIFLCTHCFPKK